MTTDDADKERQERENAFIQAIRENSTDEAARLVYADYLEEMGDERGEYLRLENLMWKIPKRMAELRALLDPSWMAAVSRNVNLVRARCPNKISAIKLVREITGQGLKEAKDTVESASGILVADIPYEQALLLQQRFKKESDTDTTFQPIEAHQRYQTALETEPAPFRVILETSTIEANRIAVLKAVRQVTLLGLKEAIDLCASVPRLLLERATSTQVAECETVFKDIAQIRVERLT